jgi:hypothetical protein
MAFDGFVCNRVGIEFFHEGIEPSGWRLLEGTRSLEDLRLAS